jgi:hypothetical protein
VRDGRERADAILALLADYDRLLLLTEHVAPLVWVRTRPRRDARVDPWRVPRLTMLVRFFVRLHVRRGVEGLHRRLSAARALGANSAIGADEEAVRLYAEAVPPTHVRAFAVAFAAGVLVVGRLAVQYAGEILSRVPDLANRSFSPGPSVNVDRTIKATSDAQQLVRRLGESLTEGVPSPGKLVDAFLSARLGDVAIVMAAASLAVYVVMRPCVSSFRFKRMLLNVGGDMAATGWTTERWSVVSRTGVFAAEESVFGSLGTRPPREFPLDLVVSGFLCVVPIGLGAYLMTKARWDPVWTGWLYFDVTLQLGLLLVFAGAARVAWLMRTWRRRCRGREAAKPPYEIQLADGRRVLVRDPLTSALIVYLVPQAFLVWLAVVARDVRRVQRARGRARASIGRATSMSALGALTISAVAGVVFLLLPVPTVWILTPADLSFAPLAWPPVTLPWLLAYVVLAVTAPTVVAYGQLLANRLLREAGTVIPEGPDEAFHGERVRAS